MIVQSDDKQAILLLLDTWLKEKQWKRGLTYVEELLLNNQEDTGYLLRKALFLTRTEAYQEAYKIFMSIGRISFPEKAYIYDFFNCLLATKNYEQLKHATQVFLSEFPEDPFVHLFLGIALCELSLLHHDRALARQSFSHLRQMYNFDSENEIANIYMGKVLVFYHHIESAKRFYKKLIQKNPQKALIYLQLAVIARLEGDFAESEFYYQKTLSILPDHLEANLFLSMAYLAQEKYEQGWETYEWRKKSTAFIQHVEPFTKPELSEQSLVGKHLLVIQEQGMGDCIQFVRFLPYLQVFLPSRVILWCAESLLSLFAYAFKDYEVIPIGASLPEYDYYVPILSLPYLLKIPTDQLMMKSPYLFADTERVLKFSPFFAPYQSQYKIGIVWSGSKKNMIDHARSISLKILLPLQALLNVQVFSLQKELDSEADSALCQATGIIHLGDQLNDFMDTAACLMHIDLLISVDTSIIHLAGAMGRPVWALISERWDWRWGYHRASTHWYPSMRLFHWTKNAGWGEAMCNILAELKKVMK